MLRAKAHHIVRSRSYRVPQVDKKGTEFFVPIPVEQRFSKEFSRKSNGWHKSDISMLVSSTSQLEMASLLQKMRATSVPSNDSSKLTLEQKFMATKPRCVDTPNERQRFMEYCMNQTGLSENDLFDLANEAERTKSDEEKVNNPNPATAQV